MASAALKKRIVDMETAFQRTTGVTSASYKQTNGVLKLQQKQGDVLHEVLEQNPIGCIIVSPWMDRRAQSLLRRFAASHPVIHILRSLEAIRDHLKIEDEAKAETLWHTGITFFRSCSNLEMFNVSESQSDDADASRTSSGSREASPPYLLLKQAERHLLKFLAQVYPAGTIPFLESAYPLATVDTEHRQFTSALSVSASDVVLGRLNVEDHVAGVDAVQITANATSHSENGTSNSHKLLINRITQAVGLVRRGGVLPVIVHLELGSNASQEATLLYLDVLCHSLTLAPELVTVDMRLDDADIARIIRMKRRSRIIGHYATSSDVPSWESPIWVSQYRRAVKLGCGVARLVRPATAVEDNLGVARFRSMIESLDEPRIPLMAYNSGMLGRHSVCFNPVLTIVTPKSFKSGSQEPHASHLTAEEATKSLFSSFWYDPMKMYVFGSSVNYSMSPAMHNSGLAACGIPHRYERYSTNAISGIRHLIQDPNFAGASVGLPFKVEAISLTHSLSPHAQAIGAINTLIPIRHLDKDGSVPTGADFFKGVNRAGPVKALYGENTDWIGIRACIRRGLSPANAVRQSSSALIIGAGGMARAAIYALLQVGVCNISIFNRTLSNGQKLAEHFRRLLQEKEFEALAAGRETKFRVLESITETWESEFRLPSIIISCIPTHPLGDVPSPEFKLPEPWLGNPTGGVVIELGYKTLDTPLLLQTKSHSSQGWVTMTGLDLLPDQGYAQFELFTGKRAPRRIMRKVVFETYTDQQGRSNLEELKVRLHSFIE